MHKKTLYVVWSLLLYLSIPFVSYAEAPLLMPIDDIRPGMKGIGKTVFSGTRIEEFDVEILSVLKSQTPHGDVIMAKVTGGPLPLEKSGVLAGMSGSPIYIEGKLIGALAFIPSTFPKEPMVAGITPIHEMLHDANRSSSEVDSSQHAFGFPQNPENSAAKVFNFVPIQTPLIVSGADQRVLEFMRGYLSPLHITPIQAGNTSQGILDDADTELKPGSAVGVQFIRGDMNMSGVGTVTYRKNNTLIAFGHPLFFSGETHLPMTAAYVNLTVSNLVTSFKMASSIKTVGTITQDRRTGVSGLVGPTPKMLPLHVTVQDQGEPSKTMQYSFEVIDHKQMISFLMKIASLNALLATEKAVGDITIRSQLTIFLKDFPPLRIEDQFTTAQSPIPSILAAFAPLDILMNNNFHPISPEHVSLEMTVEHTLKTAEIVGVQVQNNVVSPGENVQVKITLRPYNEELTTVTAALTIPEDLEQGSMQLLVCDANITTGFEAIRAPAKFQVQNFPQLMQLLRERPGQNTIMMSLFQPKPGFVVQGQELPSPPVSMMTMLSATRHAGKNSLTRGRILKQNSIPTQYVISGCTPLELIVDHKNTDRDQGRDQQDNLDKEND